MLVIRAAQLQAFLDAETQAAADWIAASLRRLDAPLVEHLSDTELQNAAAAALPRARAYGLTQPEEWADFVLAGVKFGTEFDQDPSIQAILSDHSAPCRMYQVWKHLTASRAATAAAVGKH